MNDANNAGRTILPETQGLICTVKGDPVRILLTGHDTNGAFALVERSARPGEGLPPHLHTEEDETLYVLEGEIELWTPDRTARISTGCAVFLPRNQPHCYTAIGDRPCRVLLTITPAGLEQFLREADRLGDAEERRFTALCAEYGIYFLADANAELQKREGTHRTTGELS